MAHTGNDDGFVIKINSTSGIVDWMTHYPRECAHFSIFFNPINGVRTWTVEREQWQTL